MKLHLASTALLLSAGFAPTLSKTLRRNEARNLAERRLASCLAGTSFSKTLTGPITHGEIREAVSELMTQAGEACAGTDLDSELLLLLGETSATLSTAEAVNAALQAEIDAAREKAVLPFWKVTRMGDQFDREFMNGGSDWNDQYELVSDGQTFHVLADDADIIADNVQLAASQPIQFPDYLTNFADCTLGTVMCCHVADRQGDAAGSCAAGEECVDANPISNTDICHSDMENAPVSNRVQRGLAVYDLDRDANNAEGSVNCHGFAWGENVDYAGNLLFDVAFKKSLMDKGYVKNVPGAPMCGCIEQMPVVEYADCTDITSVTETYTVSADAEGLLSVDMSSDVTYGSCGGVGGLADHYKTINTDNTGAIDSHIVGQGGCSGAVEEKLSIYGYTRSEFEIVSVQSLPEGERTVRVTFNTKPSAGAADISKYNIYVSDTSETLGLSHGIDYIDRDYIDLITVDPPVVGVSYQLETIQDISSRVAPMVKVDTGFTMAVTETKWDAITIGNSYIWGQIETPPNYSREYMSISSPEITNIIFENNGRAHGSQTGWGAWYEEKPTFSEEGVIWGNKAVQIGRWRIKQIDDTHISVSHENNNVSRIYRADGTTHGNVATFSGFLTPLGEPSCAYLTENYLQIGDWRFAEFEEERRTFLSVSHKRGKTARLYETNGSSHGGPRVDRNAWAWEKGVALQGNDECFSTSSTVPNVISFGDWKIAQMRDTNWLSFSSNYPNTPMLFQSNSRRHGGPRLDWGAWVEVPTSSAEGVQFGDKAVQIDQWRIKQFDDNHLSITHSNGVVGRVYRSDGDTFTSNSYSGYITPLGEPSCAYVSENYIRVGDWRIGQIGDHLAITHITGHTAMYYSNDGYHYYGLKYEPNSWLSGEGSVLQGSAENCNPYHDVETYVQIGSSFRLSYMLGSIGSSYLSLSSAYPDTPVFYKSDRSIHHGPRNDYNAFTNKKPALSEHGVEYGDKTVQLYDWRISEIDDEHLSITHSSGGVTRIFRSDGTIHGSVADFSGYDKELGAPSCAYLSEEYLQLGSWRIGAYSQKTISISHKEGYTSEVFDIVGNRHPGPYSDFQFSSWNLPKGSVLEGSDAGCDSTSAIA